MGLKVEELEEVEVDAGLGNGGLGRLAGLWKRMKCTFVSIIYNSVLGSVVIDSLFV